MDIGSHLLTNIQTYISKHLTTGYFMIDLFVSTIVIYYFSLFYANRHKLFNSFRDFLFNIKKNKAEYIIEGKIHSGEWNNQTINFPEEYRAIMFKLHQMNIDIKYGKKFNQIKSFQPINPVTSSFSYTIENNNIIKINDDIAIIQTNTVDKSNDLKQKTESYEMKIFSNTKDFHYLKNTIDEWNTQYNNYIKQFNNGKYYYFSYVGMKPQNNEQNAKQIPEFEIHEFSTNRTFANVFFEEKDLLKNRLDIFLNDKDRYDRLGIPYTLGLMFYGIPGCGKTSTIKAIANYTKRHVLEINLSRIKTCGELKKVFLKDLISNNYVPSNKKIIILEDIDCMTDIIEDRGLNNYEMVNIFENNFVNKIVTKNSVIDDITNNDSTNNSDPNKLKENLKIYEKMSNVIFGHKDDDKLTLSFILNLIDGVLEQPGRILIITTNFPDKLDKALIRPGRIDMKIEFKKCSDKVVREIVNFYYQTTISFNASLPHYKITPAELYALCFNNNLGDCLAKLKKL